MPWACTFQNKLALFGVAIAALALCAACAILGLEAMERAWRAGANRGRRRTTWRGTFMAIGGMVLSIGCFMILIAQTIPELILGACQ